MLDKSRLKLVQPDHPVLLTVSAPLTPEEIPELAKGTFLLMDFMRAKAGIGLAANQLGDARRWFVCERLGLVINPEIIRRSKDMEESIEGCLSFPGRSALMQRNRIITMRYSVYQHADGTIQTREVTLKMLDAFCAQHEIDHLDGKVIVDPAVNKSPLISRALAQLTSAPTGANKTVRRNLPRG